MNLTNLFGNKTKQPVPEYFLAVEIHESLIKTALWEILDGQPEVINVGSYESWADEESLINGVDSSLDQAVKVISSQPKRVIFGLPDSWMEADKIHSTKIKLITRLCKELGLDPIGAVTINRAVAHFLKKRDGVPPTCILLEVYTTKVALSYIYLGEVQNTEEVAKSGDIGPDVEEGLTRMDLSNYPARFILTNGSDLSEEAQQITAHPWQDRLPFKHLPKVESLPVDFSIKATALIGGTEAVKFMGLEVKEEEPPVLYSSTTPTHTHNPDSTSSTIDDLPSTVSAESDSDNLQIPNSYDTPHIEEHGFFYEEVAPPVGATLESTENLPTVVDDLPPTHSSPKIFDLQSESTEYTDSSDLQSDTDPSTISIPQKKFSRSFSFPKIKLPSLPKIKLGNAKKSFVWLLVLPVFLFAAFAGYLYFGQANIILHFSPQSFNQSLNLAVSQSPKTPSTLVVSSQKVSGAAKESIATTGQATVGEKSTGQITIANKTVAPLVLKKGTTVTTDNGKFIYTLDEEVTIASASSSLLDTISGKTTGVKVTATKIGAEYNLAAENTFSVDSYSRTVAIAISEKEFTGGSSRSVSAVSKVDQDKLLAQATEKIKQITSSQVSADSPGRKSIPSTELQINKKVFDKNIGEESTSLSLDLEGSLETLVYLESDLFKLVESELRSKIPAGTTIQPTSTNIKVESLQKQEGDYQATISVSASLYPIIDELRLAEFVKGKSVKNIRHFFEPIKGFTNAEVQVTPPIPLLTQILPLKNIRFQLVSN